MYRMRCEASRSYDVLLTTGLLNPANPLLAEAVGPRRALVVTVPHVEAACGDQLRAYLATLPTHVDVLVLDLHERTKTMDSVLQVCAAAQRHSLGRRDVLIAVGGGVCSDVVSVAASLVRRGIPYLCLPTTLVGQVDAGIAVKGGVNFGGGKNYLGCFAPPSAVLLDPSLLRTLPPVELRAGLAEILKVGLVLDADLVDQVTAVGPELVRTGFAEPPGVGAEVIARAVRLMLEQLSLNCYEDGPLERLMDFGHTFSPRLEELSEHRLGHGEAVAIDMALTCALGVELGLLAANEFATMMVALLSLGLPLDSPLSAPDNMLDAIRAATAHRDGKLNLVVPVRVGAAMFVPDPDDVPRSALMAAARRVRSVAGSQVPAATSA